MPTPSASEDAPTPSTSQNKQTSIMHSPPSKNQPDTPSTIHSDTAAAVIDITPSHQPARPASEVSGSTPSTTRSKAGR